MPGIRDDLACSSLYRTGGGDGAPSVPSPLCPCLQIHLSLDTSPTPCDLSDSVLTQAAKRSSRTRSSCPEVSLLHECPDLLCAVAVPGATEGIYMHRKSICTVGGFDLVLSGTASPREVTFGWGVEE